MARSSNKSHNDTDVDGNTAPIIIKKYANRRLYNTDKSCYITLDDLAAMTRGGTEFTVVDAKSGEDITRSVLTQIIMEEEARGQTMLPVSFLRQLISMYGDSMQAMVPQYLEASMDSFRQNQRQFHSALQGALSGGPLAEIAKRNMKMFEAATNAFRPHGEGKADSRKPDSGKPDGAAPDSTPNKTDARDLEIERLKAELDALKAKK